MAILPVQPEKCATCPFRPHSKYAHLAADLADSAVTKASRICHSTGANNAINRQTGRPPMLCRGARDIQLEVFAALGVISEATDEAWQATCREMGLL